MSPHRKLRSEAGEALDRAVGFHEAGHFVIAVYNGIDVQGTVSIDPADGIQGHTGILRIRPGHISDAEFALRLATVYYAGEIAERLLATDERLPVTYRGNLSDRVRTGDGGACDASQEARERAALARPEAC